MASPWNQNRVLLVVGALFVILGTYLAWNAYPVHPEMIVPVGIGAVLALAIIFYTPAWMYLVAGILAALFPLVVVFVFGAVAAIQHPGSGIEGTALTIVTMGALLALFAGIVGFVQARKGTAPAATAGWRTPQAAFAGIVVAFFVGLLFSGALASADYKQLATEPATHVEHPTSIRAAPIQMQTGGHAFAPRDVHLKAGELTDLHIKNTDPVLHTFTYDLNGAQHVSIIPADSTLDLYFELDAPQTIKFWCAPHSQGASDTDMTHMWGTIVVE